MADRPRLFTFLRRFSAYGDLTNKFQAWGTSTCPSFLEPIFATFYSAIVFLIGGPVRRGLTANLAALFPGRSAPRLLLDAYLVMWNFSFSIGDGSRSRQGQSLIDWEIEGEEHLNRLSENGGGILLTAHMGNYDVAAALFASKFGRRLNAVRAPERHAETQAWMERELAGQNSPAYAVLYNRPDRMLGLELVQAIQRGEIVAIQGDRVLFDVSPLDLAVSPSGDPEQVRLMRLPKGPFVLALVTGAPIHPLFIIRTAWRRYRVLALPPIRCQAESRDREAAIERTARAWVEEALLPAVRQHWYQWFVLEPVFSEKPEPSRG